MLAEERAQKIMQRVADEGSATVGALAASFGVAEVTIRRDLKRLHDAGLLQRTHGGAVRQLSAASRPGTAPAQAGAEPSVRASDALVLAPVRDRAARALKARALRTGTPMLAESAPQTGAVYVGPDDRAGARALGTWTAAHLPAGGGTPVVLDLTLDLPNTMNRSGGFLEGLRAALPTDVQVLSMNALGLFSQAYRVATDALKLHSDIDVVFGVNDDTILGALQAYRDLGLPPDRIVAVNVGCEGDTILDELAANGPLRACLALFPRTVGATLVDTAARIWGGMEVAATVTTPHRIVTPDTIHDVYRHVDGRWVPVAEAAESVGGPLEAAAAAAARGRRISLVVQYPTHEWYRNLALAMNERAQRLGARVHSIDVDEDLEAEAAELQRLVGKEAASHVADGETIVLDAGAATTSLARHLHDRRELTVITNSASVFHELEEAHGIEVVVVGGTFDRPSGAFVGAGARRFLADVRADKAFVVATGISAAFGLSSRTSEEAEMRQAMMRAAREVVVLADHASVGRDAPVRVAGIGQVHTLVTNGSVASDETFRFAQHGIRIVIAGASEPTRPAPADPPAAAAPASDEGVP